MQLILDVWWNEQRHLKRGVWSIAEFEFLKRVYAGITLCHSWNVGQCCGYWTLDCTYGRYADRQCANAAH
jgi:hypothetical protein